ncbi:MAG TPA: hypothetical protein VKB49_01985 [Candidatus Sulfotelmatobacter sp.]|nr:hypothetical protein [Candidatus Sulfotelmatobacter sp.]
MINANTETARGRAAFSGPRRRPQIHALQGPWSFSFTPAQSRRRPHIYRRYLRYNFRAFDVETGKELWKGQLPNSAHATPMTFLHQGKQYMVIAAGGHDKISEERPSDELVAFTLP